MANQNYWERITSNRLARRRLLKGGAAFSIGAASLALIGCGSDKEEPSATNTTASGGGGGGTPAPTATTASQAAGQPGGTYTTKFATIGNWNVGKFYHDGYNNAGITAYDRPITIDLGSDDGYHLAAMQSIELAEPTKVVLTLIPGMTFHDLEPANGRAVKGSDIVAYQEYIKGLSNAENSGFQRNFLDSIESPDDNTVVMNLTRPAAYLFSTRYLANPTAQPIVPAELIDMLDDHTSVGSGPFQLTDATQGAEYNYKRFEKWRGSKDGLPYFDGRKSLSLTDVVATETAFRGGQLDEWDNVPATSISRLQGELDKAKYNLIEYDALGIWGSNFLGNPNSDGPRPWFDIRVREAIFRLTNRQQILDLVYDGRGKLTTGPIHISLPAYQLNASDTDKYFVEDVAEAKKLLEAAQYDTSQTWDDINSNSSALNAQAGEVFQQQLARGGFKVNVTPMPLAEILPNHLSIGKYDFWLGAQPGGDVPDRAMRNFHSDTGDLFNNCGMFDPEIDALVEKSEQATDRDENISIVKQIQQKALDAYWLNYVMFTLTQYNYVNAKVQDYFLDPVGGQDYQTQAWFKA